MKNVKNVSYWQVDNVVKKIFEPKGAIVLSSPEAWKKYEWTRPYFEKKPKQGYFIWLKKQTDFPLLTCITIASPKVSQNLTNLLVVESRIKARANTTCNSLKNNLSGIHKAQGKIILKDGASLEYNHIHKWGQKDIVSPDYEFILEKDSRLTYNYQNLSPLKNLKLNTTVYCGKNSSSNLSFIVEGTNSNIESKETIFLKGENSQAILKLRLVAKENSNIKAKSKIHALSSGKGHLDCQGLLVAKDAKISLIPELICQNKEAQITHEASIGRISEEELNYLRTRGLSKEEAIDLIVSGFLKI
ncbi:SufD family Fe-S cluster assembly protein [Patescibacteria group bacterium]